MNICEVLNRSSSVKIFETFDSKLIKLFETQDQFFKGIIFELLDTLDTYIHRLETIRNVSQSLEQRKESKRKISTQHPTRTSANFRQRFG